MPGGPHAAGLLDDDADLPVAREAQETLERLFRERHRRVLAFCGAVLHDRAEAEDAAQQVFVSAFRALLGGSVPRDEGAWLAAIARHECWSRAARASSVALDDRLEDRSGGDPASTVIRRAEFAETWQAIAQLPPAQREALLLREVRGLGYAELADDLQRSQPSVRSLLARARRTLRARRDQAAGALSGASWLNALARMFADGSNPTLSTATKSAAVGLGAIAISSAALVAPGQRQNAQPAVAHRAHTSAEVTDPARTAASPLPDASPREHESGRSRPAPTPSTKGERATGGPGDGDGRRGEETRGSDSGASSSSGEGSSDTASRSPSAVSSTTGPSGGPGGGEQPSTGAGSGDMLTSTQSVDGGSSGDSSHSGDGSSGSSPVTSTVADSSGSPSSAEGSGSGSSHSGPG